MTKITLLITTLLFILSCRDNESHTKESGIKSSPDISTDRMITDPDTSLAIFLVNNAANNDYAGFYDEYQRWVLEHDTIKALIYKLYSDRSDIDSIMYKLEQKKNDIITLSRKLVVKEYLNSATITSPDFEFLCQIKDSAAFRILQEIESDTKAFEDEKLYGKKLKEKYW